MTDQQKIAVDRDFVNSLIKVLADSEVTAFVSPDNAAILNVLTVKVGSDQNVDAIKLLGKTITDNAASFSSNFNECGNAMEALRVRLTGYLGVMEEGENLNSMDASDFDT